MIEFWEAAFQGKQEMWGMEPAHSTFIARDLFIQHLVKNVLVPGIGYGRNARVFTEAGMKVTGIEISQTAIDLAQIHFGKDLTIHHGSVTDMPFDDHLYEGIFCYGLIYLLDGDERAKLIRDCYHQLVDGGLMIFIAITKEAKTYGQGMHISKDRYEMFGGVKIFFYDLETIEEEFGHVGLVEAFDVVENYPFYFVLCKKEVST